MTAKEKIEKVKTQFVLRERFFATLLMQMSMIEDKKCDTIWTDGKQIGYNPQFILSLSEEEVMFCLVHEIFHKTNRHHLRRDNRESEQWNIACDYAINQNIINLGFKAPKGILVDNKFFGKSAEQIYSLLPNKNSNESNESNESNNKSSNDPGKCGEIRDMKNEDGSEMSEAEKSSEEAKTKMDIAQASRVASQVNQISEGMKRIIGELQAPTKDWRTELMVYMNQYAKENTDWTRPNRRYVHTGFFFPSRKSQNLGNVVLVLDSSGSINNKIFDSFISEIKSLMEIFNLTLTVIVCDDHIQSITEDVNADEISNIKIAGWGGTDFNPPFKWLVKNGIEPNLLIYFTDLYCYSFPKEPEYPVVWASWGRTNAPFGHIINVK